MSSYTVLAFDFGASSGRAIKAVFDGEGLSCSEVHRFENNPVTKDGTLYWDIENLFAEVHEGIKKAGKFDSIGFDTWGVDFGLLGEDGKLLESPVHYRDTRTNGMINEVEKIVSNFKLYKKTGNQIMNINTLFQLMALKDKNPELLRKAKTLLFMPDLFAYELTGKAVCEATIASTSQMLNPKTRQWDDEILSELKLPRELLLPVISSGTVTGMLGGAKVIAVAGHDTQCAVAALPTDESDVAFLSCGTWSLLGTELDEPILTSHSQDLALSNELGANGKINYLKNIIGLWLIQESRREWRRQGSEYSYADLEREALAVQPLRCFIDPDSPEFGVPGDIPALVGEYCRRTGQYVPQTVGEVMRCIYESLALKYRYAIEQLHEATGKSFKALHILGGGTKDKLLCQMTANSCHMHVTAGPIEATALGNIIIQLVALGALKSIAEGRKLIAKTEKLKEYEPTEHGAWEDAFESYKKIMKQEEK
ncbi:MAG: rhamnulokinase family protein [Hydrogenoanaerobacterium sp.]